VGGRFWGGGGAGGGFFIWGGGPSGGDRDFLNDEIDGNGTSTVAIVSLRCLDKRRTGKRHQKKPTADLQMARPSP